MRLIERTFASPEENVAFDERLLDEAIAAKRDGRPIEETLRLWEPEQIFVVVGRSSDPAVEVKLSECERRGVPMLRRCSGGAAIVAGPGCLMYAVVLSAAREMDLAKVGLAHAFVLGRLEAELNKHVPGVRRLGISDLAVVSQGRYEWTALKFSGNSLRIKQGCVLYHGTLLYNFPLEDIGALLNEPPRQPDYRDRRSHAAFVENLPLNRERLRQAVIDAFDG